MRKNTKMWVLLSVILASFLILGLTTLVNADYNFNDTVNIQFSDSNMTFFQKTVGGFKLMAIKAVSGSGGLPFMNIEDGVFIHDSGNNEVSVNIASNDYTKIWRTAMYNGGDLELWKVGLPNSFVWLHNPLRVDYVVAAGSLAAEDLTGSYSGGSAYVCVYNNGTLYASDSVC